MVGMKQQVDRTEAQDNADVVWPISTLAVMGPVIERGVERRQFGMICGPSGCGKTTTLKVTRERLWNAGLSALHLTVPATARDVTNTKDGKVGLRWLCEVTNTSVDGLHPDPEQLRSALVERFSDWRQADVALLLDEAENCSSGLLKHLRQLHDTVGLSIWLIGLPLLARRLSAKWDNVGQFESFRSRLDVNLLLDQLSAADHAAVARAIGLEGRRGVELVSATIRLRGLHGVSRIVRSIHQTRGADGQVSLQEYADEMLLAGIAPGERR